MRKSIARPSRFDKDFRPVENTLEVLRAAKKRLGKPTRILKNEKTISYWFAHFFGTPKRIKVIQISSLTAHIEEIKEYTF